MEKLRSYAQSISISFESWIISFVGIVIIRALFEQFSSFKSGEFILIDLPAIIHLGAFFLAAIIALMVILMFFAKTNIKEVSTICLFGFSVILLAPIIDLITGGVGGHGMSYLFVSGKELLILFITFLGGHTTLGATIGIQVELVIVIIACFLYVYSATKNIIRSAGAAFAFYCLIFFLGSVPSILVLLSSDQNEVNVSIVQHIVSSSIIQNNINPNFTATNNGLLGLGFDKLMIGINTLVTLLASLFLFIFGARKKFIVIMKNCRIERMLHLFLLFIFGAALAHTAWFINWIDIQSYILALVAFFCAAMFSVCQNDIQDEVIDAVSNPNRPLVSKDLSKSEMNTVSKIFLFLAFLSAYASSHYVLFFTSLSVFVYYIYSNPPLRLKRFAILSSSLVSLAHLSVIIAGFFLVNQNKNITSFPFGLAIAIFVFFLIVSNIRDIKDVEGDKAGEIRTLPVLLGVEKSKKLIAGLGCILFLLIPWYLKISFLIVPSIVASLLSWYFVTEEDYKEWKVFVVYLIYLILIIGSIIFK